MAADGPLLTTLLLLLLVTIMTIVPPEVSASRDDLYDEVTDELNVNVSLHCTNSTDYEEEDNMHIINNSLPYSWMLPNLTVLYPGSGADRFEFINENWTLKVINVTQDDLGLYHCMLRSEWEEWYLLRIGLNAEGPYFEDLWEKYDMNTIIGLSAGFGFLVLAIICILLYKFRYRPPGDRSSMSSSTRSVELVNAYSIGVRDDISDGGVVIATVRENYAFDTSDETPVKENKTETRSSSKTTSSSSSSSSASYQMEVTHDGEYSDTAF